MQGRAAGLDASEAFPAADFAWLDKLGALLAPLPNAEGGLGAGTQPQGAATLLEVLRLLGRGNPAVGRLFEAHVNARRADRPLRQAGPVGRRRGRPSVWPLG